MSLFRSSLSSLLSILKRILLASYRTLIGIHPSINQRNSHFFILFFLVPFMASTPLFSQDATAIIKKMDQKIRGLSSYSEISMTIVRPDWDRTVQMKAWTKGTEYSLILITQPPRDEGTAFLKRENEIWNWVPSIARTVKLPPSMMMQSWMGSDFTNDDLVKESSVVIDYEHTLIGDTLYAGYQCYIIEMIPKPDAPVVWGKITSWVAQEEFLQLRTEFYDEDETLVNLMVGSDLKVFDDRLLPARLEMLPTDKPGNKTILEYHHLEFNLNLNDRFFSVQNMRRIQ